MLRHLTVPSLPALDPATEPFATTAFTTHPFLPQPWLSSWGLRLGSGRQQTGSTGVGRGAHCLWSPGRHRGELRVHFLLSPEGGRG